MAPTLNSQSPPHVFREVLSRAAGLLGILRSDAGEGPGEALEVRALPASRNVAVGPEGKGVLRRGGGSVGASVACVGSLVHR